MTCADCKDQNTQGLPFEPVRFCKRCSKTVAERAMDSASSRYT